jgi:hypothetical protein
VAAGGQHTVGLKSDGTVVAVGDDTFGQVSHVSSWTGITQVAAGYWHTVGLKSNGTVVAVGYNDDGECEVSSWTGITQVAAGEVHTVGLKSDGTMVAVGDNSDGECEVGDWNLGTAPPPAIPAVVGDYSIKGSVRFFDWKCNKWIVVQSGTLHITYQYKHKIQGYWEPGISIEGWPALVPVKGYVGPFVRDAKLKIKNTPRLSLVLELGEFCKYPSPTYVTYILNAAIKWDKKKDTVKSMKGTINGWGEYSTEFTDRGGPSQGQFEGKFTATPLPGGTGVPEGGMEYIEYAQSATEMGGLNLPTDGLVMIPDVVDDYPIKSSIKFFDWKCNKWIVVKSGTLHITGQAEHKIKGYFEPGTPIEGWPELVSAKGYVGPFVRDAKDKIKNTPRLSLRLEIGEYCQYPDETYVTYILNAKIKVDKKTDPPLVKSIKGTINGWGEFGTAFDDGGPSVGQFEGKFTATPAP